jgi:hypothetical protein
MGRILRGVRAGERHSASNDTALLGVPEVISLESDWFLNGTQMPLRSRPFSAHKMATTAILSRKHPR